MPCWWILMRMKQLSMAATTMVIRLCCWPYRAAELVRVIQCLNWCGLLISSDSCNLLKSDPFLHLLHGDFRLLTYSKLPAVLHGMWWVRGPGNEIKPPEKFFPWNVVQFDWKEMSFHEFDRFWFNVTKVTSVLSSFSKYVSKAFCPRSLRNAKKWSRSN